MQSRQDFQSTPRCNRPAVTKTAGVRVFTFDGQGIRCIEINGERMFAPVDIYRCIGLADPTGSAKFFLRGAVSIQADAWPYPGRKPRVINAHGVLDLLDSVRGERKSRAHAMREWFKASVLPEADDCSDTVTAARPAGPCMAEIADRLDPDVQAALRDAFLAIQEVSVRLSASLDRRAELMAAITAERAVVGLAARPERRDQPRP